MSQNKSTFALNTFIAAGVAGLACDFGLGALWGWKDAHTLSHFCFGLGFPLFWVAIVSVKRKSDRKPWQITFDDKVIQRLGDGFWLGVAITAIWSLWNEIIVYRVYNPAHSADWHHWFADQLGIFMAYVIIYAIRWHTAQPSNLNSTKG